MIFQKDKSKHSTRNSIVDLHELNQISFTQHLLTNNYFGGAPKSLQMVTAAMKLKDAYSLEEKL